MGDRQRQHRLLVELWVVYGSLRLGLYTREQAQTRIREIRDQLTPENRSLAADMFHDRDARVMDLQIISKPSLN